MSWRRVRILFVRVARGLLTLLMGVVGLLITCLAAERGPRRRDGRGPETTVPPPTGR